MTTAADFQAAIDAHTTAVLVGAPNNYSVVRPNTSNPGLANGSAPWIKQEIVLTSQTQLGLGVTGPCRNRGELLFSVYVQKNTGNAVLNTMRHQIYRAFRSKRVGGVTFLNALAPFRVEVGSWSVTGIRIPFYFDDTSST